MNLYELGEFGFIERIAERVKGRTDVRTGIGDDAAVTVATEGRVQLTTTDMLVEGIHFDLNFCDAVSLGKKSLAVNLSDIAAMGGIPRHFYLSLAIPRTCSYEFLDQFITGLIAMADAHDVVLAGGDTCASLNGLVVSVTVVGEQLPDLVIRRSGAKPGDQIFVTGCLGDSALGLAMLRAGERHGTFIDRHLLPTPRVVAGKTLAEARIATAMIDISDGLAADLGHILKTSGVGARVEEDMLPLSEAFWEQAIEYTDDPIRLAISGGEDYELLFTAPALNDQVLSLLRHDGLPVTRIGEITEGEELFIVKKNGTLRLLGKAGYDHFT